MENIKEFVKKNYVLCAFVGLFVMLFVFMFAFGILKRGTFSLDEGNRLVIDCPESFSAGEVVECDVSLVLEDGMKVYSVNANYDFTDGMTYVSFGVTNPECTGEGCLEPFVITENGFSVVNVDGLVGNIEVGKLKVTMPSTVEANHEYNVALTDVEISYGDNIDMMSLANASDTLRAKNNVATLSSLAIENVSFDDNQEFSSDVLQYTATVNNNVNTVTIEYTLNDQNATVSGNGSVGSVNLHYGTNAFNIVVTAEDGVTSKTYVLNIYCEYEFSTDKYVYNKTNNYIYTGNDTGDVIISNLEELGDDLSYSIANNKLVIKYGEDENLLSINIINFSITNSIVDKNIYIQNNLTFQGLLDGITTNGLTFRLNDGNNDISDSSTVLSANYKLDVYYNDVKLDSYNFVVDYLHFDNSLIIDDNKKIIKQLKIGTTVGELKSKIDASGTVRIVPYIGGNGTGYLDDDEVISSGYKLIIDMNGTTIIYTLSVLGDVTGDGIIDIDDIGVLYRYYRGKRSLDDWFISAGEIVNDGIIDIDDVGILYRYYRGKRTSLEV